MEIAPKFGNLLWASIFLSELLSLSAQKSKNDKKLSSSEVVATMSTNNDTDASNTANSYYTPGDVLLKIDSLNEKCQRYFLYHGKPWRGGRGYQSIQLDVLLPLLKENVKRGTNKSIRDLMYDRGAIFFSEDNLKNLVDTICDKTGLSRRQLNIVSDSSASWMAAYDKFRVKFEADGAVFSYEPPNINQSLYGRPLPDALLAMADPINEKLTFIAGNSTGWPKWLLLFEKKDWVEELIRNGFLKNNDAIIICSRGRAPHNTHAFVKLLHSAFPGMKIVAFGDAGPFGVSIVQTYYYANTFGAKYSVPVSWGGLLPSEIGDDNDMEYAVSSFGTGDRRMDTSTRNHCWVLDSLGNHDILRELNIMRDEGKKWDMNAYKPSNDQSITAYVTDILEGGEYLEGPSRGIKE